MSTKFLTVLLLLSLSAHAAWTTGTDDKIDPKPLTWWRDSWTARPIEVSRSNASSTDVTLTFKVRTSTDLPEGGVFEVYFPSSFTAPSGSVNNSEVISQDKAVTAGTETTIEISEVKMPSQAGPYGPFRIVSRPSTNGQIYDMNNSFGSVYVTQPISTDGQLTVMPDQGSSVTVLDSVTIQFSFNVNIDIWPHDTFVIHVPEKWTIPASLEVCTSNDVEGVENYFKSNDQMHPHQLQCTPSSSERAIYIYGIAEEIDVSEKGGDDNQLTLELAISGFTAPSADWDSTNYKWTVEILQWGTRHVKRSYKGEGPNTTPDAIIVNNWQPHNGYAGTEIVQGMSMYMDVSFTVSNPINQNGKIVVTYNNVQMHTTAWKYSADLSASQGTGYCYLAWQGRDIPCVTANGEVTLSLDNGSVDANTTFILTNLVYFNNASPSVSVKSYWKDENSNFVEVDRSNSFSFPYLTQNVIQAKKFKLVFHEGNPNYSTATYKTGSASAKYIAAFIEINTATFAAGTTADFSLNLPTNNTGLSDTTIYINSSGTNTLQAKYDLHNTTATDITVNTNSLATTITGTPTTNKLTVSNIDIGGKLGGNFGFYNNSGAVPSAMHLPRVASNIATRYESWFVATIGSAKYVKFQVLTFEEDAFTSPTVRRGCGNLMYITFQVPFETDTTQVETRTYYLEYSFHSSYTAALGTQLSDGNAFPHFVHSGFSGITATYSASYKVNIQGQDVYTNTGTPDYGIWFATKNDAATKTFDITLYYTDSSDPLILNKILKSTGVTDPGTAGLNGNSNSLGSSQSPKVLEALSQVSFTGVDSSGLDNDKVHSVQFHQGFTFDSTATISVTDGTPATLTKTGKIQSTNVFFAYPSILGISNGGCENAAACAISVTGARASAYVKSAATISGGNSALTGADDGECYDSNTQTIQVTVGAIEVNSVSPSGSVVGRGPTSYDSQLIVEFTTTNGIPTGGFIQIEMVSDWAPTMNSCEVDGLDNLSTDNPLVCSRSGYTFTISSFQAFTGSKTITVTFNHVMPPTNTSNLSGVNAPTSLIFSFIKTFTVVNFVNTQIDEITSITNSVTVEPQGVVGKSDFTIARTFPPNANETLADLYIMFSLDHTIPSGSTIEIDSATGSWSLPSGQIKNYVYFSKKYSAVSSTSTRITITTAEVIEQGNDLELYIEQALTNPASTSTNGFLIKTTYNDVVFDQDQSGSTDANHKLNVEAAIDGVITEMTESDNTNGIVMTNSTAGEYSDYTFNFSSDRTILATDEIYIKFPKAYDAYLGKAYIKYQEGDLRKTYFIDCTNTILNSKIECSVDRWYVRIFNLQEVVADTLVSITIKDVKNPAATSQTDDFQIFQTRNNVAVASNRTLDGVTITGLVSNITVKSVEALDDRAFKSADYSLQFYLPNATTLTSETCLVVELPRQYNTNLSRGSEAISCTLDLQFSSDDTENTFVYGLGDISSCSTDRNKISMCMPESFSQEFAASTRFYYRVSNMANPEWGIVRPQSGTFNWDFDANDFDVFTQYDIWTNQFDVSVYQTNTKQLLARSYQDVNNAYHGFQLKSRGFAVNSYSEKSRMNQITVVPGLMTSNISISTNQGDSEPLAADKLVFTPKINSYTSDSGKVTFSSDNNFTMYHLQPKINFRVAAAIDITQGLYYINWTIDETKLDGAIENLYDPPTKTLVQVYKEYEGTFTIESIAVIGIGQTSRPIRITASNAPHTAVNIDITLEDSNVTGITIQPQTLNFSKGVTQRYFTIQVDSNYEIGNSTSQQTLKFALSGTDTSAYSEINSVIFNINNNPQTEAGAVTQCSHSGVTRTTVTPEATADSNGVIYWAIAPVGTNIESLDYIKGQLGDYFGTSSSSVSSSTDNENEPEVKPSTTDEGNTRLDSWTAFERRLYKNYLMTTTYLGANVCTAGTLITIPQVTGLMAETNYNSWCYVQNESQLGSEAVSDSFKTNNMPEAATFTITFAGTVSSNSTESLKNLWTRVAGIQPSRAIRELRTVTGGQSGTTTQTAFSWTVPALRGLEQPTPIEEVTLTPEQEAELKEGIKSLAIDKTATFTYSNIPRSSVATPSWVTNAAPELSGFTTKNSISVSAQCSTTGEICGICTEQNDSIVVNYNQVLLGLNQDNEAADGAACENYSDINSNKVITISGLASFTNYSCYYVCYNEYPTWPTPNEEIVTGIVKAQTAEAPEETNDFAENMKAVLALILILVV